MSVSNVYPLVAERGWTDTALPDRRPYGAVLVIVIEPL